MKTLYSIGIAALGVMSVSTAKARITVNPFYFSPSKAITNFKVSSAGWSDPKWQGLGVAENNGWGILHANKGQTITLVMQSATLGIHPAASVWHRGKNDIENDNILPNFAFTPMETMASWTATSDCVAATCPVDLVMQYVAHGYDADKNPVKKTLFKGLKDGVSGRLTVNFKAAYTGVYMFTVGGYNPAPFIDSSKNYLIKTSVMVK